MGLQQKQVAQQIGVDMSTITNWEINRTIPAIRFMPRIIEFLGYTPFPPAQTLPEKLILYRKVMGLSRRKLAKLIEVDESNLAGWETGKHYPTNKSLKMIEAFLGSRLK